MRIKEDLINKEVLDGGAELIGKVVDVVMDKDTFEVTDLVIKKTGIADQIKAGGENVVPSELVKVIGDKILLKIITHTSKKTTICIVVFYFNDNEIHLNFGYLDDY